MKRSQITYNPYSCTREDTPTGTDFFFTTDWEVRYVAHFSSYGYLFGADQIGCQFYSFDLFPVGMYKPPKGTPEDLRIAATVQYLFATWFEQMSNIIIAVYEDSDRLQHARRKKFESWFEDSGVDYIEKHDFEFTEEEGTRLASLFIHMDFVAKEQAITNFISAIVNGHVSI
ncbi:hypothetical protein EXU85_09290 [Spirosoma sp. KCTC 42546]|uniref:DUF6169 family protein n=1 Tax=Spirosoma sp. KCTC 42546 TaxID=2520506 RepID=UPI001159C90C|nr:DUF6169 family protein [Spirosoma sp. KCTC 42546]QDK78788.1 hypothetical protein EXU85_09290 [Spirosoma sp. KCTC 42546]